MTYPTTVASQTRGSGADVFTIPNCMDATCKFADGTLPRASAAPLAFLLSFFRGGEPERSIVLLESEVVMILRRIGPAIVWVEDDLGRYFVGDEEARDEEPSIHLQIGK